MPHPSSSLRSSSFAGVNQWGFCQNAACAASMWRPALGAKLLAETSSQMRHSTPAPGVPPTGSRPRTFEPFPQTIPVLTQHIPALRPTGCECRIFLHAQNQEYYFLYDFINLGTWHAICLNLYIKIIGHTNKDLVRKYLGDKYDSLSPYFITIWSPLIRRRK
jgi:hypothetical protein